jgi:glucosyl-3-phosphoglycerate synthase
MRSPAVQDGPDGETLLASTVQRWLVDRSTRTAQWPVSRLLRAKGGTRISVLIPARDEEATVGAIVDEIRRELVEAAPLVDELILIDSRSRDATAAVAAAAGATVIAQDAVLPHLPTLDGKGDALWKGLVASTGDLVVFVDADVHDFTAAFVTGLLGPLLCKPGTAFVKGFYHRPLVAPGTVVPDGGGRVSELVARPLLALHWPELAGFVQPLAGEYAGRRSALERIPFVTGYGVELGMLIDLLELVGLDAMSQVDLGSRTHRHHDIEALGRMAGQIMLTATSRLERHGRVVATGPPNTVLTQFRRTGDFSGTGVDREVVITDLAVGERPPLVDLAAAEPGAELPAGRGGP